MKQTGHIIIKYTYIENNDSKPDKKLYFVFKYIKSYTFLFYTHKQKYVNVYNISTISYGIVSYNNV